MNMFGEYDYESDLLTYYEHRIQSLERNRRKIVLRGKLSATEDRRLDEIDTEIIYWLDCIDAMSDYSEDEDGV